MLFSRNDKGPITKCKLNFNAKMIFLMKIVGVKEGFDKTLTPGQLTSKMQWEIKITINF